MSFKADASRGQVANARDRFVPRSEDDIPTERIYLEPITKTVRKVPEVELLRALDEVDADELEGFVEHRYRPSTSVREFLRRCLDIKQGK